MNEDEVPEFGWSVFDTELAMQFFENVELIFQDGQT